MAAGPAIPAGQEADLDMRILLVHGDEQVGAGMPAQPQGCACTQKAEAS